jgi:hypothetical protein
MTVNGADILDMTDERIRRLAALPGHSARWIDLVLSEARYRGLV